MTKQPIPVDCDFATLPGMTRDRAEHVAGGLFARAVAVRELLDGYVVQLGDSPDTLVLAAEFIEIDRKCCSFLRHSLVIEEGGGAIWLQLTGAGGSEGSYRGRLARLLPDGVRSC